VGFNLIFLLGGFTNSIKKALVEARACAAFLIVLVNRLGFIIKNYHVDKNKITTIIITINTTIKQPAFNVCKKQPSCGLTTTLGSILYSGIVDCVTTKGYAH